MAMSTVLAVCGENRKRRANVIDRTAAAWILQGALDRLRNG